jgi:hypothetical protein
MLQVSHPLPAGIKPCGIGHRPQLVETRGAPRTHRIGTPAPPQWHVECAICSTATVPAFSRELALRAWRTRRDSNHIPLSMLAQVRSRIASAIAATHAA